MKRWIPWLVAVAVLVVRWTCRVRISRDPRPKLKAEGTPYILAILHAHHLTGLVAAERGLTVMISRSRDGDIAIPAVRLSGCRAVRGSGGSHRKGGGPAIARMVKEVRAGNPAVLTVDGPQGPRGVVHPGIAFLARATGAAVIPVAAVSTRRKFLDRTWDRLQIPLPFARIELRTSAPLFFRPNDTIDSFARRVGTELARLEASADPEEAGRHARPDSQPVRCARAA